MRRAVASAALVALMLAAVALPATAASAGDAPRVRYYEGPTSEGGRVRIRVVVSNDVQHLSLLLVDGPYLCEDGAEGEVENGFGWFRGGPVIEDEHLDLSENWNVIAFMVSGRLGSQRGSGTLTFLMPGFTADQQAAQVCTLGELTWSVERTAGGGFPSRPAATVQGARGGTLAMGFGTNGFESSTPLARAQAGPIRRYRGRTSQNLRMAARTQGADSGITLLGLSLGSVMVCEDGSEEEWGFFLPQSPTVLPPGRLDFDEEPTLESSWAVHIHGELDTHSGSGTTAQIVSVLTDDLQAQLCNSGEQTWELWRTDARY